MATASAAAVAVKVVAVVDAALFEGHELYTHLPWSCTHMKGGEVAHVFGRQY